MLNETHTETLLKMKDLQKKAGKILTEVKKLENDPLFVIFEYDDSGFGIYTAEYYEWFYENNLIGKLEDFDFTLQDVLHLRIVGFRFKNQTDATAFKLRWT